MCTTGTDSTPLFAKVARGLVEFLALCLLEHETVAAVALVGCACECERGFVCVCVCVCA